ncbi:MAG: TerB family tellurite resistance protein [Deltaproteobacteria bacterium]|jgi:uncharacterized membrane protein YebE (DUF533 family)|nr:TerB family tellurite resistance protein [Deltaproteobacteria bacterium]MBW2534116.1 TerB family tellurite resistance protein [Deltaproteobacteria bacterium]
MQPTLNRHVFLALATVAWADGSLAPEEREGILRAAGGAGFSSEECAELDAAIQKPRDIDSLNLGRLSAIDRVFVYATAVWLARIDGVVDPGEVAALQRLGDKLMVSDKKRKLADNLAVEVAAMPTGNRPDKYDLVSLRKLVEQRVTHTLPPT